MARKYDHLKWEALGAALKAASLRSTPPLKQRELAAKLSVTPPMISYLMGGAGHKLGDAKVDLACEILGVDPAEFLSGGAEGSKLWLCSNPGCPRGFLLLESPETSWYMPWFSDKPRKFCAGCAEKLTSICPQCGENIVERGAFCSACGKTFVTLPEDTASRVHFRRVGDMKAYNEHLKHWTG